MIRPLAPALLKPLGMKTLEQKIIIVLVAFTLWFQVVPAKAQFAQAYQAGASVGMNTGVSLQNDQVTVTIPSLDPLTEKILPDYFEDGLATVTGGMQLLYQDLDEVVINGEEKDLTPLGCNGQYAKVTMSYDVDVPFRSDTLKAEIKSRGEIQSDIDLDDATATVTFHVEFFTNKCVYLQWLDNKDGVNDDTFSYDLTIALNDLDGNFDFAVDAEDSAFAVTSVTDFSLGLTDLSISDSLGGDDLEDEIGDLLVLIQGLSEISGWNWEVNILGDWISFGGYVANPADGIWTYGECTSVDDCARAIANSYIDTDENKEQIRAALDEAIGAALTIEGSGSTGSGGYTYDIALDDVKTGSGEIKTTWDADITAASTVEACGNLTAQSAGVSSNGSLMTGDIRVGVPYSVMSGPLASVLNDFCLDLASMDHGVRVETSVMPDGVLAITPGSTEGAPSWQPSVTNGVAVGPNSSGLKSLPQKGTVLELGTQVASTNGDSSEDVALEHPLSITLPLSATIERSVNGRARSQTVSGGLALTTEIKLDCASNGVYLDQVTADVESFVSQFPSTMQSDMTDKVNQRVEQLNQDHFPFYIIPKVTDLGDIGYAIDLADMDLGDGGASLAFDIVDADTCGGAGDGGETPIDGPTGGGKFGGGIIIIDNDPRDGFTGGETGGSDGPVEFSGSEAESRF